MSERYFVDLDIHGEVIRFYPDDGKTRLHQNDARRIPVESVAFVRERAIAEAVAAEREKNATYLNAFWAASSLDGEEVVVTIKLHAPFVMDEKVKDTIRRILNESAAK